MKFSHILILITTLSFQTLAQEMKTYKIEFDWQNEIANKINKDALDYFYLLPSVFINCEGASMGMYKTLENRRSIKPKLSEDRDYLGFYRVAELSVLRKSHGGDVIAIQSGRCAAGNTCGAINSTFVFEGGVWKESSGILPKSINDVLVAPADEICPYIDLSKTKNGVVLMDLYSEKPIAEAIWNGKRFVEKK